jgi:hypothetical protein
MLRSNYTAIVRLTLDPPPYASVIVHTEQYKVWLHIHNSISKTTFLHSFSCLQTNVISLH